MIRERSDLNLPASKSIFPFRKTQREALELALSNAPVVAIAGLPGSGKTEIAMDALQTAIAHQRSTLVVSPFSSTFHRYKQLPVPFLELNNAQDYRQNVRTWVRQQLQTTQLDFVPLHWLEDLLFKELQIRKSRQFWLGLLTPEEQDDKIERLRLEIQNIFPNIHEKRRDLLMHRLRKSYRLLEQQEHLFQDYTSLSERAIEQIVDEVITHIQPLTLCHINNLKVIENRSFDLVIIEDGHHLPERQLKKVAIHAHKLVIMGELTKSNGLLDHFFHNLLPAYRIIITENHRLHPNLANHIFPALYPSQPIPYTPLLSSRNVLEQIYCRLQWIDVKSSENLIQALYQNIEDNKVENLCILTNSNQLSDQLKAQFPKLSDLVFSNFEDIVGREFHSLIYACDSHNQSPFNYGDLRIIFTRAREYITVIGNRNHFQKLFKQISSKFHYVRNIEILED
ncbi:hypothetical protein [Lyngbya confervoides]|uniref:DNA helicase n=1 Tax=Lyngbya confervoides BDU141951 TaxID=1574623 RepID=A0ABD4T0J5_9CYAN|nr:hypothetical protein [Lyngbya confervoides]MCM1982028.1 hypothetical protein [Lyngbya confervoides BDU141951]